MSLTKIPEEMLAFAITPGEPSPEPGLDDLYTFQTVAEAEAASPGVNVTVFRTLSHTTPRDGGGGIYWYTTNPATAAVITCANGRKYELATDVVNVKQFGALGRDGASGLYDDRPAFIAAFAYAKIKKKPVYAPAGIYHFYSAITLDWAPNFRGDGNQTALRAHDMTTEIFRFDCGASGQINYPDFRNFEAQAYFSSSGIAHTGVVFRVVGTGSPYFQWGKFYDISCRGFYSFFTSQGSSHVTAFGNEGPTNWCRWKNITFGAFTRRQQVGWAFNTGSGTGNTFTDNTGFIDLYVWLYQSESVVGDIVIKGGHWGSYNTATSTVFAVGSNAQYRSRIRIQGLQADAGMSRLLSLSSTPGTFVDVVVDVTLGGGCSMGNYPVLTNSSLGFTRATVAAA